MAELLEEIKQIKDKFTETLEATTAAQTKASELDERTKKTDTTLQATIEASSKAAEELQNLKVKVDAVEKAAEYIEKSISRMNPNGGEQGNELEAKAKHEMIGYLRSKQELSEDVVEAATKSIAMASLHGVPQSMIDNEMKTLMAGSNPDGGYFIRPEVSAKIIQRRFETSPIRSIADIQSTNSDSVEFLIDDDEAASGGWVGETQSRPETATPKIGKLTIPIHEQFCQPKATQKMLDDGGFDVEAWLSGKVTRKMARTENTAFVVGDGSQKPLGFLSLPAWTLAGTYQRNALEQVESGTVGAFVADTIKELQSTLIEDYQASAVFGCKRSAWNEITILKDGQGNYLLDPRSMKIGDSLQLLGKRVIFMEDMPAVANDSLSLVYGDFGVGYTIVDRMGFRVIRDNLTDKPNIKFYTTSRVGAAPSNFEALKVYKLS